MSTRKLILAALACGFAIILAGAIWLLSLDNTVHEIQQTPPPPNVSTTLIR